MKHINEKILTQDMKIEKEIIKNVNRRKKLPLGKLPLGNILYLCGVKPLL